MFRTIIIAASLLLLVLCLVSVAIPASQTDSAATDGRFLNCFSETAGGAPVLLAKSIVVKLDYFSESGG